MTVFSLLLGSSLVSADMSTCPRREGLELRRITPDEADSYLGTWTSTMDGPTGPATFKIAIRIDQGEVVATVTSDLMSDGKVERITKLEDRVALCYTAELFGYTAPVELTLIPRGDELEASFSIMRQFELRGIATRERPNRRWSSSPS
jgi:hypothetical protein